jgi:hypothetical protein
MAAPGQSAGGHQPWGKIVALLAACAATLIGVIHGLAPETIVVRAVGAAVLLGGMAAFTSALIERFLSSR